MVLKRTEDTPKPELPPTDVHEGQAAKVERYGLPRPDGYSLSYWLQQVRCDPLLNYRSSETLPESADCVIIGSGITGCLAAQQLRKEWPHANIVILEAREFCSGATGRNAGHCKPDQWRGFTKYETQFGAEQALKILHNEQETWQKLTTYVHDHKVDCDLWTGDTYDVPMTPQVARIAAETLQRFKIAGGDVSYIRVTNDPSEAARITRLKNAQACYAWPASTLQPRKLVGHIMRSNLESGIQLHTFTVVTSISGVDDDWTLATSRGSINTKTIIHASNAYIGAYEPLFRDLIYPRPHMCSQVLPPHSFAGEKVLQNSYGVLLEGGGLFSINPRNTSDGNVMFGGDNPGQQELNRYLLEHSELCVDDGLANIPSVTESVISFTNEEFEGWESEEKQGPGNGYNYSWSGIIALTKDGVPFVGEIPGKKGQWVCVGHNGHGMARVFTLGSGLAKLVAGKEWKETGMPECFALNKERIERLNRQT